MKELRGISAAPGVAMGKAFLYTDDESPSIPRYGIRVGDIESEWARLTDAVRAAEEEVRELAERASLEMGVEHAKIFEAHLLMLGDPDLMEQIRDRLTAQKRNIEWVVWDLARDLYQKMSAAQDAYLRERAIDISDVSQRLLNRLLHVKKMSLAELPDDVVLVTHNLLPSDTLVMDKKRVKGIAMNMGGRTSHTAILARAFEIPAVLGLTEATREIASGDFVIVDGSSGIVLVNPEEAVVERYRGLTERMRADVSNLLSERDLPAVTTDGRRVALKANIEIPEEADHVLDHGAEGIGLYRSEFLFLSSGYKADEESQYEAYKRVIEALPGKPVTIRTLDVGGDKIIPELQEEEKNPLLGWRAIRFCLAHRELFKTQLRALIRASAAGDLRIMFPMISGIEEYEAALEVLEEAKAECRAKGHTCCDSLTVGLMVEIPSAAMTADILAARTAFFSIGTNDLVQYSLAADRGNERVAYLAQPFHPAVLRFIKTTIDAAHAAGIPAAMCGELAGDPMATAVLLGFGLDEFSMSAASIPLVKRIIRGSSAADCASLAEQALKLCSYRDVEALVRSWMDVRFPSLKSEL